MLANIQDDLPGESPVRRPLSEKIMFQVRPLAFIILWNVLVAISGGPVLGSGIHSQYSNILCSINIEGDLGHRVTNKPIQYSILARVDYLLLAGALMSSATMGYSRQ